MASVEIETPVETVTAETVESTETEKPVIEKNTFCMIFFTTCYVGISQNEQALDACVFIFLISPVIRMYTLDPLDDIFYDILGSTFLGKSWN